MCPSSKETATICVTFNLPASFDATLFGFILLIFLGCHCALKLGIKASYKHNSPVNISRLQHSVRLHKSSYELYHGDVLTWDFKTYKKLLSSLWKLYCSLFPSSWSTIYHLSMFPVTWIWNAWSPSYNSTCYNCPPSIFDYSAIYSISNVYLLLVSRK